MHGNAVDDHALGAVDAYVAELGRALYGPRRLRTEMLTEARDSLVDAVQAYEEDGVPRATAQRRAVREFGAVRELAPAYQRELGVAQSRRVALALLLVLGPQRLVWAAADQPPTTVPPAWTSALQASMPWLGLTAMALAVGVVAASGVGLRWFGEPPAWLTRATGMLGLGAAVLICASSLALMLGSRDGTAVLAPTGLPWAVAFVVVPMLGVAVSARRCLVASAAAARLA